MKTDKYEEFAVSTPEDEFSYRYGRFCAGNMAEGGLHIPGEAICLCLSGSAEAIVGTERYKLEKSVEIILLSENSMFITGCSPDFMLDMFSFSRKMSFQAMRKFDPLFFRYIKDNPVYRHTSHITYSTTLSYMNILAGLQEDSRNRFNVIIATNLLRSLMLTIYDKVLRYEAVFGGGTVGRKKILFDRFIALLNEHGRTHRDVSWYADRLCISSRYLCSVVRETAGEFPKAIIDRHIISEIKLLLTFSDLSVQQIADRLDFPDQSYLGRFFRKAVGMSPTAYRKVEMTM